MIRAEIRAVLLAVPAIVAALLGSHGTGAVLALIPVVTIVGQIVTDLMDAKIEYVRTLSKGGNE